MACGGVAAGSRWLLSGGLLAAVVVVVVVVVVVPVPGVGGSMQENIYASGCSGDEVKLQCPPGHRIAIKRLFYGVKRSWDCQEVPRKAACCHAAHTDCLINDDRKYPTLNTHCSGYQECKILVQEAPASAHCPNAPHTDYMTVIYDCVPDLDIAMFCSNDVKRGKTLYLSNMEYPSSVEAQKADCMCMVRTNGGSEGVNIHSIDVLLAWPEHGTRSCSKELAIKDEKGYRWNIQCGHLGYYGFRTIYTRPVQNVTLTLKSSAAKGSAFVWLQAKATADDEQVEIFCGEPLRQILLRMRQEVESRHRNRGNKSDRTTTATDRGQAKNSTYPYSAHMGSLSSNLAAIIGGIVAAGFILISIVIIAIAFHCKRVQQAKEKNKQSLNLYPAVTNGEATTLTSYCHYNDYDDDHYSSINRSPLKMSSLTDSDIATTHARTNGFVTLGSSAQAPAQAQAQAPESQGGMRVNELGAGAAGSRTLPHPPPPTARDALLSDPGYSGHLSLRYSRPANGQVHSADVHEGHKTLPGDHRNAKILVSGPKSPLGKRSKSVTFCQPVAMVTPLPSGSEESVGGRGVAAEEGVGLGGGGEEEEEGEEEVFLKGSPTSSLEDGNYDNLNKIVIPDHPLSPSLVHTMPIHHRRPADAVVFGYHHGNPASAGSPQRAAPGQATCNSLPRSMSTFRSEEGMGGREGGGGGGGEPKDYDEMPFNLPPPPLPLANGDTYAVVHKKPVPLPVFHPQRQNAQLYETGV